MFVALLLPVKWSIIILDINNKIVYSLATQQGSVFWRTNTSYKSKWCFMLYITSQLNHIDSKQWATRNCTAFGEVSSLLCVFADLSIHKSTHFATDSYVIHRNSGISQPFHVKRQLLYCGMHHQAVSWFEIRLRKLFTVFKSIHIDLNTKYLMCYLIILYYFLTDLQRHLAWCWKWRNRHPVFSQKVPAMSSSVTSWLSQRRAEYDWRDAPTSQCLHHSQL